MLAPTPMTPIRRVILYALNPDTGELYPVKTHTIFGIGAIPVVARWKTDLPLYYGYYVSSSGTSVDYDVSLYSSIRLMVNVSTLSGTSPTLSVYIEGKYENTNYYETLLYKENINAVGNYVLGQIDNLVFRYIRVRWVLSGTNPVCTFGVVGQAMT
jgi:hypothetical protein